jgi:hypothetical protein
MFDGELPISFGYYLFLTKRHTIIETDPHNIPYIRLGKVLALSSWLYEIGATLGWIWKDKIPTLVKMWELEVEVEAFIKHWKKRAGERLKQYGSTPKSFQVFIAQTDLERLWGSNIDELEQVVNIKLIEHSADKSLSHASSASIVEGIMFGSKFPELTENMLRNTYENNDRETIDEALKFGVVLPGKSPANTVVNMKIKAKKLAHDYMQQYYPELLNVLA